MCRFHDLWPRVTPELYRQLLRGATARNASKAVIRRIMALRPPANHDGTGTEHRKLKPTPAWPPIYPARLELKNPSRFFGEVAIE